MIGEFMPNSRPNGMPAYQKIQATIVKRIDSGQLKPGDAVDSERELAKIHQVSLMTARHALTALEREGLVHRRRGAGTFVAPPKIHFNKLARGSLFSTLESSYGIQIAYADEEMDATAAAPATANLLKVPRDAPLLRIRQVIYSTKGKATLYVLGLYRSDRHTLLVRRFR